MSNVFEISSPLPSRNLDKLRQEIWISVKEELDIQDERRKELKRSKEEENNASSKASSEEDDTSDITKDFVDLKGNALFITEFYNHDYKTVLYEKKKLFWNRKSKVLDLYFFPQFGGIFIPFLETVTFMLYASRI